MVADLKKVKRAVYIPYGILALFTIVTSAFSGSPGPCDIPLFLVILIYASPVMILVLLITGIISVSHRPYRPLFIYTIVVNIIFFVSVFVALIIVDAVRHLFGA